MAAFLIPPIYEKMIKSRYLPDMRIILVIAALLMVGASEARDRNQVRHFRAHNACPATGKTTGACPGYVVDHVVPLCASGPDTPANMQWQTVADSKAKDRREVRYCARLRSKRTTCEWTI